MKNTIKFFGIITVITIIGFTMAACSNDGGGDTALTYKGINSSGDEYELKITGDNYELFSGSNKSTGTVTGKTGTTYTLKPSVTATTFTATVTQEGLRELAGSITWDSGGSMVTLPGQLTTTGGPGSNGGSGDGDQSLPAAVGKNEVGGKTYYRYYWNKIEFAKSSGSNGSCVLYSKRWLNDDYDLDANGKFKWDINATGTYTWNEGTKTVTLKPEKVSVDGKLLDKAGLKSYIIATYSDISIQDIDAMLNEEFATGQYTYSFSNDGKSLFMHYTLPKPKGTDELVGKTYCYARRYSESGPLVIDPRQYYVFGSNRNYTTTYYYEYCVRLPDAYYFYSYDSTQKLVYLGIVLDDLVWSEVADYYDSLKIDDVDQNNPNEANHFIDNAAYRAYLTDKYWFYDKFTKYDYDPDKKIIFNDGEISGEPGGE